mgnify:FL=1
MYAVADIQLAFDNSAMQKMLTKRADALKAGKFDKAKDIQRQMTKYKDLNFDALTTPRLFYCTFHTEYAYKKAIQFNSFNFMKF